MSDRERARRCPACPHANGYHVSTGKAPHQADYAQDDVYCVVCEAWCVGDGAVEVGGSTGRDLLAGAGGGRR